MIGEIAPVTITEVRSNSLCGSLVATPAQPVSAEMVEA